MEYLYLIPPLIEERANYSNLNINENKTNSFKHLINDLHIIYMLSGVNDSVSDSLDYIRAKHNADVNYDFTEASLSPMLSLLLSKLNVFNQIVKDC